MRKVVLVKGHHNILKVTEINGKAHAVTDNGTFKIRNNLHSNSFLVYSPVNSSVVGHVSGILELSPMNMREVYNTIPFSTLSDIKLVPLDNLLSLDAIKCFSKEFYLFNLGFSVAKLEYSEMIRIVMYMQTLNRPDDFNLLDLSSQLNRRLKDWILETFSGNSIELGLFILLECIKNEKLEDFITEWKRKDLLEVDIKALINSLGSSFLEKTEKNSVKTYLAKFV